MIRSFRDLVAWKKGMDLAVSAYRMSEAFPADERFGMTSQLRRAAVSVPCNVAEGFGRSSRADFVHFLDVSLGSTNEVETVILLAERLGYVDGKAAAPTLDLASEERRILKGLIESLPIAERKGLRDQRGHDETGATETA
jgi:four helix bundle protein